MALSLRNPETQAKVSSGLTIAAVVALLAALMVAFSRFSWETLEFIYGSGNMRAPVVFGLGGLSLVLAGAALWFAYASAGERRNPRQGLSWACFATSAFLIVIGCVFLYAYRALALVVQT